MYPTGHGRLYLMPAAVLLLLLFAQHRQLITFPGSGRVASAMPDALHGAWFACLTWVLLTVAVSTPRHHRANGGDRSRDRDRHRAAASGEVLLVASLWPIVPAILLDRYLDSIAPDLVRFDSPRAGKLIRSGSATQIVTAPGGWSVTGPVLRVTLAAERWPGVSLDDPMPDWQRYSTLDVDRFVEGPAPMPLTISVRSDIAPVDHVYRQFTCAPGPCRLHLPFTDLFDRTVARVNAVVSYSEREEAGRMFYLGRVALRE